MSSTQVTASPRAPRPRHNQQPKNANQTQPSNGARQPQRRRGGNRANNGNNVNGHQQRNVADSVNNLYLAEAQGAALSDSAIVSGGEIQNPSGSRHSKKHTASQPSSDRVPPASLTDSELGPNNHTSGTPAKAQGAYAGPTFHASPAPSALPIPKFLSRSVPAKTRTGPPTPPYEGSDDASSPTPSPPSPSRAPIPVPPRNEDSPLDLLFKADRAERARNVNFSPGPGQLPGSPDHFTNRGPHHSKHGSQSSLNAVFPIELDAEGQNSARSPRPVAPANHRAATAPSKLPQAETSVPHGDDSVAIQDLLDRLSFSQAQPSTNTPPRTVGRMSSDPSSQFNSPSPFNRSVSGPTTPAPPNQDQPDFFYGNRNLSPLFKAAAKPDLTKRNSGLRTEITADSPLLSHGEFTPFPNVQKPDFQAAPQNYTHQAFNGQSSPRRGSAPQVQPYQESPNHRKPRTPGRGQYRPRPDYQTHGNHNNASNGQPVSVPKTNPFIPSSVKASVPKPNPFVPSSVKAKQYPSTAQASDSSSLEQDLKRLLNVKMSDAAGVR